MEGDIEFMSTEQEKFDQATNEAWNAIYEFWWVYDYWGDPEVSCESDPLLAGDGLWTGATEQAS